MWKYFKIQQEILANKVVQKRLKLRKKRKYFLYFQYIASMLTPRESPCIISESYYKYWNDILLYFDTYAKTLTNRRFGLKKLSWKKARNCEKMRKKIVFPLHCINGKPLESLPCIIPASYYKYLMIYYCISTLT